MKRKTSCPATSAPAVHDTAVPFSPSPVYRYPSAFPAAAPALWPMGLLLLLLCLLGGCHSSDKKDEDKKPVPVLLVTAEQKNIARVLDAVGNVEPAATVAIKPQVAGQIVDAPVRSGQDVKKGQVLFRIDPRPFEAAVNEAKARLMRDKVVLKKAEEDRERFQRLVRQDAISRDQFDQAVTNAESQKAVVLQDEATLASAQLQLEYATIRAPMSGRIGEVLIDPGNVVTANNEQHMVVINTMAPVKVLFSVPERNLPDVLEEFRKREITVQATPEGDTHGPVQGLLTSIDNSVDKSTGTIKLEAMFPNTDLRLWPGQFTRIRMELAALENAVLIPSPAVLEGVSGPYVYVVKPDHTVEIRLVEVSRAPDSRFLIVHKGLKAGETLVLDGQLNLVPGAAVEAKRAVPADADGADGQDAGKAGADAKDAKQGGRP